MLTGDLALFFLIGLLGGAHCIGMCGPLVTVYANRLNEQTDSRRTVLTPFEVRQHGLFNLGRATSYAVIGGVLAFVGGVLFVAMDTVTATADVVRGSVGILVGLFVMVVGLYYILGRTDPAGAAHIPGLGFERISQFLTRWVDRLVGGPGMFGLGAIHGLLPCPILYPAFLYAFATGSPVRGALSLAALGLGTIPAVFAYGTLVESVDPVRRKRLHRVLGVLFLTLGYIPLAHGLHLFGIHLPHPPIPFYQPFEELAVHH